MSSELVTLIEVNTRIEGIGTLDRLRGLRIRASSSLVAPPTTAGDPLELVI
jgi:hypothetical protein